MKQFNKFNVLFLLGLAACNQSGDKADSVEEAYQGEQTAKFAQEVAEAHEATTGSKVMQAAGWTAAAAATAVGAIAGYNYFYGGQAQDGTPMPEVDLGPVCYSNEDPNFMEMQGMCPVVGEPAEADFPSVEEGFTFLNGSDSNF